MNAFVSRGLITLAVAGGIIAFGASAAQADDGTDGNGGLLSGLQGIIDATIPVHVGGNSISVIGDSSSSGATSGGSSSSGSSGSNASTGGTDSVLGGTQGVLGIDVPAVVSGNAISVLGDSSSSGSSFAGSSGAGSSGSGSSGSGSSTTSGEDSTLGGTQVLGDVAAPVTVSGNAISVLGDSSSGGGATGGVDGEDPGQPGEVGGETTTPGATAGVGAEVALLAATGSGLQAWLLAVATLLVAAGATLTARVHFVR